MSSSDLAFIVNPAAGNGSTQSVWSSIEAIARDRLGLFETYFTTGPGTAVSLTKKAVSKEVRRLVSVGGDGTLNEVINGLMEIDDTLRSDLVLGVVPNGTGCDLIKTVSIPTDINEAVDLIAAARYKTIDLGRLFYLDHHGDENCRYFHNITSFGLGGEVVERVNRTTKMFGPFFSFLWSTLVSIFLYGKKKVHLRVGDGFARECIIWNVAVANGQYHGGGMWVAPDAAVDDGLFDVTVIGDLRLFEVFLNLPKLYNGKIKEVDKVITLTGKKVEASSDQKVLLDVDGEQLGTLPAIFDIQPGALKIISD
ncbi:MAG: diacylglycerol/lipid kinase family protein [Desulfobacterales bacterium]